MCSSDLLTALLTHVDAWRIVNARVAITEFVDGLTAFDAPDTNEAP